MPLLKASYINHYGQEIKFGEGDGLFLNEHDLLNFSWNIQTRGSRIIGTNRRGVRESKLPLIIVAQTETEAYKFANDLFSVCEADLQENKKGRLVVNGYNLRCFISGQEYSDWSDARKCIKISATVIRDSVWYKILEPLNFNSGNIPLPVEDVVQDGTATLAPATAEEWTSGEKGYNYGYPYDYPNTAREYNLLNDSGTKLSWKAVIFGPATDIQFEIGGHTYAVPNLTLDTGERLEITAKEDMEEKTVVKVTASGTRENCFSYRSLTSYLFEPIPTGNQLISCADDLVWRLTPIIERSTPEWL